MISIKTIHAREILDSRGNPTVEVDVTLDDGAFGHSTTLMTGRAAVPSGASTGTNEAVELRDGDKKRYGGKGVLKAVSNVNGEIAKALIGKSAESQKEIDDLLIALDGTENKSRLGANAVLGVSMALAQANSRSRRIPLFEYVRTLSKSPREPIMPLPQCNIINGGAHTNWESTDIQEFMIMPIGAKSFREALRTMTEIFHSAKKVIAQKGYGTTVGDEGGYAPKVTGGNEEALYLISEAVKKAGYELGKDVVLGLDGAASEFLVEGKYVLAREGKKLTSEEMIAWYGGLQKKYPIVSIEDGLGEDDWAGWKKLTESLGGNTQIIGDDLLVTNVKFLERGIKEKAANAILIKVNQIGTLSETIDAVDMAHSAGWRAVISHRSGETEDTAIAHVAVGLGTGQIKTGSVSRTDRTAKYNELIRIEEMLGAKAIFAGKDALL